MRNCFDIFHGLKVVLKGTILYIRQIINVYVVLRLRKNIHDVFENVTLEIKENGAFQICSEQRGWQS